MQKAITLKAIANTTLIIGLRSIWYLRLIIKQIPHPKLKLVDNISIKY